MNTCIVCKKNTKNKLYCSRKCFNTKRPNMVKHKSESKNCKECNAQFDTKIKTQIYCSSICYNNVRRRKISTLNCVVCGNSFDFLVTNNMHRRTCSYECRSKDINWIKSNQEKNLNQMKNTGPNKLELAGRKILEEIGIEFQEQEMCDRFVVDVLIPEKNIVIQWDGDYWHGHPNNLKNGTPNKIQKDSMYRDKYVNKGLEMAGYTVLRFWQCDVYENPNLVKEMIENKFFDINIKTIKL